MKNNMTADMTYFLAGLAAGGAIALLLAPRSGEETRAQIKEGAQKHADALRQKSEEMIAQASEVVRTGKEAVIQGRDRVRSEVRRAEAALQAGKDAFHNAAVAEA